MSCDQSNPRLFDELAGRLGEWFLRRGEWFLKPKTQNLKPINNSFNPLLDRANEGMGTRLAPHSGNPE